MLPLADKKSRVVQASNSATIRILIVFQTFVLAANSAPTSFNFCYRNLLMGLNRPDWMQLALKSSTRVDGLLFGCVRERASQCG